MKKSEKVTISVDKETLDLMDIAKEQGVNRSTLVRMAVKHFVKMYYPIYFDDYEKNKTQEENM